MRLTKLALVISTMAFVFSCGKSGGNGSDVTTGNNPVNDVITQNSPGEQAQCMDTQRPASLFGTWQKTVHSDVGTVTYIVELGSSYVNLTKVCNYNGGQTTQVSVNAFATFIGGVNPEYSVNQNKYASAPVPGTQYSCTVNLQNRQLAIDYVGGCLNLNILSSTKVLFTPTMNLYDYNRFGN